jgi:DNA repair protein RecN (Recombination protein N)
MLVKLSVHNYALIKELDLGFENGLTIITGETGAGKSILLGALSLILGNRADTSVLLDKSVKCVVEGSFRIEGYDLSEFFNANELDYDPVTIIRREINPAGKSRAFINDTPVTVNILKEIGEKLIDIHSQHQTLMLNDNSFQLNVIDSFAGNASLRNEYHAVYSSYRKLKKEYSELKEKADQNKADLEYYRFQLSQLLEAKLVKGEEEELHKEQEILTHAGEIKLYLETAAGLLNSEESSILGMLKELKLTLSKAKAYLPEAENFYTRTDTALIDLDDLAVDVTRLSASVDIDPDRLIKVNDRLDLIWSLIQKHRVKDLSELLEKQGELDARVNSIVTSDERMEALGQELASEYKSLKTLAEKISAGRNAVIPKVELNISELLKQLGMPNGKFRIEISQANDFFSTGCDKADFLFSANRQIPPENLTRVASGGELSRVMLSLKSLLSKNTNLPTIIFDEIDSGVSGEVADKVGQILSEMGQSMQVVNITHLPQVASRGTKHYHVYKDDTGDSTITRVKLLTYNERIIEVARLLSGSEVTDAAIKNAKELLGAAMN